MRRSTVSLGSGPYPQPGSYGRGAGRVGPRPDAELAVNAREVRFDRFDSDEEHRGDLFVRKTFGHELGYTPFRGGEYVACGRSSGDSLQLGVRLLRPETGAELLEDSERGVERCPGGTPLLEPSLQDAAREQRASLVKGRLSRSCSLSA